MEPDRLPNGLEELGQIRLRKYSEILDLNTQTTTESFKNIRLLKWLAKKMSFQTEIFLTMGLTQYYRIAFIRARFEQPIVLLSL